MPRKAAKRELLKPQKKDKRYVRRTKDGKFTDYPRRREQVTKPGSSAKSENG